MQVLGRQLWWCESAPDRSSQPGSLCLPRPPCAAELKRGELRCAGVRGQLGTLLTPVLTGPGPLLHPCSGGSHLLGHRAWAVLIVPSRVLDTSVSGPCLQPQPVWVRWICVVPGAVPLCAGETAFWKRKELVSKGWGCQWGEVGSGLCFSEC